MDQQKEKLHIRVIRGALEDEKAPWHLYKWCIIFFETSMSLSLGIFIAFWMVLFPRFYQQALDGEGMFAGNKPKAQRLFELTLICFDHFHPQLAHAIDWSFNHIRFDMRHYTPLFAIYAIYSVFNYVTTIRHGSAFYFTADWVNTPGLALEWVFCIFFVTLISFAFCFYITQAKLRKYNRLTRKASKTKAPGKRHYIA